MASFQYFGKAVMKVLRWRPRAVSEEEEKVTLEVSTEDPGTLIDPPDDGNTLSVPEEVLGSECACVDADAEVTSAPRDQLETESAGTEQPEDLATGSGSLRFAPGWGDLNFSGGRDSQVTSKIKVVFSAVEPNLFQKKKCWVECFMGTKRQGSCAEVWLR